MKSSVLSSSSSLAVNAANKQSILSGVYLSHPALRAEVMSRGIRFPAPWLRGSVTERVAVFVGERGRVWGLPVCVSRWGGGKHRWSRCWELYCGGSIASCRLVLFFIVMMVSLAFLSLVCVTRRRPWLQVGGLLQTRQALWKSKMVLLEIQRLACGTTAI